MAELRYRINAWENGVQVKPSATKGCSEFKLPSKATSWSLHVQKQDGYVGHDISFKSESTFTRLQRLADDGPFHSNPSLSLYLVPTNKDAGPRQDTRPNPFLAQAHEGTTLIQPKVAL